MCLWQPYLDAIQCHHAEDQIRDCDEVDLSELINDTDKMFDIADKHLHTFPFKDVRACWFRLYTDTCVTKAVKLLLEYDSISTRANDRWQSIQQDFCGRVVTHLDMAFIMAGGLGREEMIHEILDKLRPRLADTGTSRLSGLLSPEEHSIPCSLHQIGHLRSPSLLTFSRHVWETREPIVLDDILDHWPALTKWTTCEFWTETSLQGLRLVPIELGRSYTDDEWGQSIMPFGTFLDHHIVHHGDHQTGYLAQHDLLSQFRSLRTDFAIPDYCYVDAPRHEASSPATGSEQIRNYKTSHPSMIPNATVTDDDDVQMNIWFGPPWTISPLHHDPYHNILCQVVGKKYIRLYAPANTQRLFPRGTEPAPHTTEADTTATVDMSNTSSIDLAAIELSPSEDWDVLYPGFNDVPFVDVILEAGQALYIPIGWWHYVRSVTIGISISFWWK